MTRRVRSELGSCILAALLWLAPGWSWAQATDADNDTISDVDEDAAVKIDSDADKVPDYLDPETDGDGISDAIEAGDSDLGTPPVDTDKDGIPDFRDVDSDNDGVPDAVEDANGNGKLDKDETDRLVGDTDGDGLLDGQEDRNHNGQVDPGESDPTKPDSDGDGIQDARDRCALTPEDFDGIQDQDGCPEDDADADGLPDVLEKGHRCLNPLNSDTDADGLLDGQEDRNRNGQVDPGETDPCHPDTDRDGVVDGNDRCPLEPEDLDGYQDRDGCPEGGPPGPDKDSDKDGLPDRIEIPGCTDEFDPDTDKDGRSDGDEDANHNGRVDAGETDPCVADVYPRGGAGCAVGRASEGGSGALGAILLIGLLLFGAAMRRRRGSD
ncbi:MAG: hypothetical protein IT371_24965 [Deltaproteobacteria bacterium]|nr:hypothetical protein [Deltaproteobacteria bacterium]